MSMRGGQLSVRQIRKLVSAVTIKGKSLIKADLGSCERIDIVIASKLGAGCLGKSFQTGDNHESDRIHTSLTDRG